MHRSTLSPQRGMCQGENHKAVNNGQPCKKARESNWNKNKLEARKMWWDNFSKKKKQISLLQRGSLKTEEDLDHCWVKKKKSLESSGSIRFPSREAVSMFTCTQETRLLREIRSCRKLYDMWSPCAQKKQPQKTQGGASDGVGATFQVQVRRYNTTHKVRFE